MLIKVFIIPYRYRDKKKLDEDSATPVMNDILLQAKNLHTYFETEDGLVRAVSGIDLIISVARQSVWWENPAVAKA